MAKANLTAATSKAKDKAHGILTAAMADKAKGKDKPYWIWSSDQEGFGLRVQPTGARAYYFAARVAGKLKFQRIGSYSDLPFDNAEIVAGDLANDLAIARLKKGTYEPEKIISAALPAEAKVEAAPRTLRDAWAFYVAGHLGKKTSATDATKKVETNAGALMSRPVAELSRKEVKLALVGIEAKGVFRNVVQSLRAACNYCAAEEMEGWPLTLANPFHGIKLPKLTPRTRKLGGADLANFGKAAADFADTAAGTFLLGLAVSGARLNELRQARVEEWDSKRRRLRLAADRMKNDEPGVLVFGPVVARRIDALAKGKMPSARLFPGSDPKGLRDFRKPMQAVLKLAECRHVTFHDLRRSCAGALVTARFDHAVIHQYLNHKPDEVTHSYLTLDADDERRDEMAAAAEVALGLAKSTPAKKSKQAQREQQEAA